MTVSFHILKKLHIGQTWMWYSLDGLFQNCVWFHCLMSIMAALLLIGWKTGNHWTSFSSERMEGRKPNWVQNYNFFQLFNFECTWWGLFQRCIVHTRLDIYVFSSPGQRPCELLSWVCVRPSSSVSFSHLNLLWKPLNRFEPNLPEMLIWNSTWLPGPIMCFDWLKF